MRFSTRGRGFKRVPGPLVALVVATSLQAVFHFGGIATIGSAFGGIPQGLPHFSFPSVTLAQVISLIGPAFTIAMLGAIAGLASREGVEVRGAESVGVSFPGFFDLLAQLAQRTREFG